MKTFFAFFALCLVAANALSVPIIATNYEGLVDNIVNEATNIAVQTAIALEHQWEEIVVDPLQQVDAAIQSIEERREEDADCVAPEDPVVAEVVDTMHSEMNHCGIVAAKTSAEIANDVNAATQQIVFDGYDVARTYQKCKNYKNSVLKNSCYARLSIKATLYLKNARKSMKTIKEANQRVPEVFTDADACTHTSSDKAVEQLNAVQTKIDSCVQRKH